MGHFDEIVQRLEADWPSWQVWYVPRAVGGMTWCARLRADHSHVLNADSPGALEQLLAQDQESRP